MTRPVVVLVYRNQQAQCALCLYLGVDCRLSTRTLDAELSEGIIDITQSLKQMDEQLDLLRAQQPNSVALRGLAAPRLLDNVFASDRHYLNLPPSSPESLVWAKHVLTFVCGQGSRQSSNQ